jgi:ectoine hydroxylase
MPHSPISNQQIHEYREQGFVLAKKFFGREDIAMLSRAAKEDRVMDQHSVSTRDGEGGQVRLSLWNHPGDTI